MVICLNLRSVMDSATFGFVCSIVMFCGFIEFTKGQAIPDYCEGESFTATCDAGEVIVIDTARYGRMRNGRCISDLGTQGCEVNVQQHLDRLCSGRRECSVKVTDLLGAASRQCHRDYRSYLEASFTCVPVVAVSGAGCSGAEFIRTTQPQGYIASITTEESQCGGIDTPWLVEVEPGQRINFTLWNFNGHTVNHHQQQPICHVYAIIKDLDSMATRTICSTGVRTHLEYTSEAHRVEVRIVSLNEQDEPSEDKVYFMLQYQATGCADPKLSPGGFLQRAGDNAIIGCNGEEQKWRLKCVNGKWRGTYGNCTHALMSQSSTTGMWHMMTDAHGVSVAIIIGVAVLVGLVILVIGLVCLRSMRRQHAMMKRVPDQYSAAGSAVGAYPHGDMHGRNHQGYPPGDKACEPLDPSAAAAMAIGGPGGMENNYYRTWQLQQHHHQKPYPGEHRSPPPYGGGGGGGGGDGGDTLPYVEHIYESPKFDHKDYSSGGVGDVYDEEVNGAQYYELDPTTESEGNSCPLQVPRPGSIRAPGGVYNSASINVDTRGQVSR